MRNADRVDYIARTRALYASFPPYRWADNRSVPVPWTPLAKPLRACRLLLIATGGIYRDDQPPFGLDDDTSIRAIDVRTPTSRLRVSHFGYPIEYAEQDPNCVFPLDRLRSLAAGGTVGKLAEVAVTCMGGIYSQRRVRDELAPAILEVAREQGVDLAYLVPA